MVRKGISRAPRPAEARPVTESVDAQVQNVSPGKTTSATFNWELAGFKYIDGVKGSSSSAVEGEAETPASDFRRSSRKRTLESDSLDAGNAAPSPQGRLSPSQGAKRARAPRHITGGQQQQQPPSKYSHLPLLRDVLEPGLICAFVGLNPGVQTARSGHAYAHPSNLFWKLLHASGCTDRRCRPEEDGDLPRLYAMGNTNIVARPTKDGAELTKAEMAAGTRVLDEKFRRFKPEAVCIVGKGIWEAVWRYRYGRNPSKTEFHYGWQAERDNFGRPGRGEVELGADGRPWKGSKVFVATTTSGLAAGMSGAEKEEIWRPFGEWVKKRREERAQEAAAAPERAPIEADAEQAPS